MDSQQNPTVNNDHLAHNGKCPNVKETTDMNSLTVFSYDNMKEKMLCFYSGQPFTDEDEKFIVKHLGKKVNIIIKLFYLFCIQFLFNQSVILYIYINLNLFKFYILYFLILNYNYNFLIILCI